MVCYLVSFHKNKRYAEFKKNTSVNFLVLGSMYCLQKKLSFCNILTFRKAFDSIPDFKYTTVKSIPTYSLF